MRDKITADLSRRARRAGTLGVSTLVLSALLYYVTGCLVGMNAGGQKSLWRLSDDRWEATECIYAAAITLTTVGYTDVLGTEVCRVWEDPAGRRRWESNTDGHEDPGYDRSKERLAADHSGWTRLVSSFQVIVGMAFFLYVIGEATAFFAAGGVDRLRRTVRRDRRLARIRDHVVVFGASEGVLPLLERLDTEDVPAVVIDGDDSRLERVRREHPATPCILGDGTEESVLRFARIDRARAFITTVGDDRLALGAVVGARQVRDDLRIVCRGVGPDSTRRLAAAGAAQVVVTDAIVGMRAASELIRPHVVEFLDLLLVHGEREDLHVEGLGVGEAWAGHALGSLESRKRAGMDVPVLARADGAFVYNPAAGEVLRAEDQLGVFGSRAELRRLREHLANGPEAGTPEPPAGEGEPRDDGPAPPGPHGGHYLICGCGSVGGHIAREVRASGRRFVIVEWDADVAQRLRAEFGDASVVCGDAQDPEVLDRAGVREARGLVCAGPTDRDSLVVAVTAAQARPGLRLVAVVREQRHEVRLSRAGCRTVLLGRVGVGGVAAGVLRPKVVGFLERMREHEEGIRFEGVAVTLRGAVAGKTLGEARIHERTGLRIIALRRPGERSFVPHPDPNEVLASGTMVIVIGSAPQVSRVVELVGDWD